MKKQILFGGMLLLAAAFTGCTEDFKNWASPQTNSPEDAITIPGFTASAVAAQDLDTDAETVPTFSLSSASLPEGYELGNARIELTPQGVEDADATIVNTTVNGYASVETLQDLVVEAYGKRPTARAFDGHVLVNAVKDGQAVYIDAGTIEVNLIPKAPYIAQNYYVVGGTKDWAGSAASKEQKFSHSDADVYDDPIFTIVIDGNPDGDTWFAIGDDEGCDAITNDNDWSKLLGIVGGDSNATEGKLDYRYNMGADNSFCVSGGAKKIKITIDMMESTFQVTKVNISDNYYLIGGPGEWSAESAKTMPFSHSDKDVFDDPVFTYTFASTGGEMWFAFGDGDAIDAVAAGDWNQLFGTRGESTDLSGSFDRRTNLGGDHSFCVDGQAKFYRLSVNMAEMTYEITPLLFSDYIYLACDYNGWSTSASPLAHLGDGAYEGFYYIQQADEASTWGFKIVIDGTWCGGDHAVAASGTFVPNGGDNLNCATGFYQVKANQATNTWELVKVEQMSIIGSAVNGDSTWGTDADMTFSTDEGCWVYEGPLTAGEFKFRMNHDWAISWGGTDFNNLTSQNGANLTLADGDNYRVTFKPNCNGLGEYTITPAN